MSSASAGPAFCPNCGQPVRPGMRFCTSCGQPLGALSPPTGGPSVVPARAGRRRGIGCGSCLLALLALVLVVAGSGILLVGLFRNGAITQHQIMQAIGQGTGEISIANLSDGVLTMQLDTLDPQASDATIAQGTIKSFEIHGASEINPGRYRLTVTSTPGAPGGGACSMKIASGDVYQIVVVRTGAMISRGSGKPSSADDLAFPTSPLCQQ